MKKYILIFEGEDIFSADNYSKNDFEALCDGISENEWVELKKWE